MEANDWFSSSKKKVDTETEIAGVQDIFFFTIKISLNEDSHKCVDSSTDRTLRCSTVTEMRKKSTSIKHLTNRDGGTL